MPDIDQVRSGASDAASDAVEAMERALRDLRREVDGLRGSRSRGPGIIGLIVLGVLVAVAAIVGSRMAAGDRDDDWT